MILTVSAEDISMFSDAVCEGENAYTSKHKEAIPMIHETKFQTPPTRDRRIAVDPDETVYVVQPDGTVAVYVDPERSDDPDIAAGCDLVRQWRNVRSISAGPCGVACLTRDGRVQFTFENRRIQNIIEKWTGIACISVAGDIAAAAEDGTVVYTGYEGFAEETGYIGQWRDVVSLSAEPQGANLVAVRRDGSVLTTASLVLTDCTELICAVGNWTDMVFVKLSGNFWIEEQLFVVGLRRDGTVLAAGANDEGQCGVGLWANVIAIDAGDKHSLGLCADGTVLAAGSNQAGQCETGKWKNVVDIAAGNNISVGLCADGTILCTDAGRRFPVTGVCGAQVWEHSSDIVK